jgi:hypothetical protein
MFFGLTVKKVGQAFYGLKVRVFFMKSSKFAGGQKGFWRFENAQKMKDLNQKIIEYPFITFWLECVATTSFNV